MSIGSSSFTSTSEIGIQCDLLNPVGTSTPMASEASASEGGAYQDSKDITFDDDLNSGYSS